MKSKYANKIKVKMIKIKNKWVYNGAIRSVYISYMEVCMASAVQLKLMNKGSRYASLTNGIVAFVFAVYLYLVMVLMTLTIFRYKRNFHRQSFKSKFINMYHGIKYWKKDVGISLYYWPMFLFN